MITATHSGGQSDPLSARCRTRRTSGRPVSYNWANVTTWLGEGRRLRMVGVRLCRETEGSRSWRSPMSLSGSLPASWHTSLTPDSSSDWILSCLSLPRPSANRSCSPSGWRFPRLDAWKRLAGLVAGAVYLEALIADRLEKGVPGHQHHHDRRDHGDLARGAVVGGQIHTTGGSRSARTTRARGAAILDSGPDDFHGRRRRDLRRGEGLASVSEATFLLILVWAMCFVAVGLVCLWAVIGDARPLRRSPVVFVLSPILGAFFAFAADAHPAGWIYILLIMVLYPTALLGSLFVVRSCGYRLVRSAEASPGRPDDGRRCEMTNSGSAHREAGYNCVVRVRRRSVLRTGLLPFLDGDRSLLEEGPKSRKVGTVSSGPISRPWRRFLRFSVRGLIVVVLLIGGGLGWLVRRRSHPA